MKSLHRTPGLILLMMMTMLLLMLMIIIIIMVYELGKQSATSCARGDTI